MGLEELRGKIDAVDNELIKLIGERTRIAREIGEVKNRKGQPVTDSEREALLLKRVRELARKQGLNEDQAEDIYLRLFKIAKEVQGAVVAFQGERGAYSEEAALSYFGAATETRPCESVDDVFRLTENREVPFGIVPVENSLEGSVSRVYDLLLESGVRVSGEIEIRIAHALIGSPATLLDGIKKVYSHPQALAQCGRFLRQLGVELIPSYDTAGSVAMLKEKGLADSGAIASERAAEIYSMKVLAREIEDNPRNFTRFLVLSQKDAPVTGRDKTSIVFAVKHQPGTLYGALKEFASARISLTRIESRPTKKTPWEYNFYVDFEGHRENPAVRKVLEKLERVCLFVKVLGSYPRGI